MKDRPSRKVFFYLNHSFLHAILLLTKMAGLLIVVISTGFSHGIDDLPYLPANEYEAQRMINDGTLDSLTWDQIRIYYIQPISVPYGELGILYQIFHDHFDNLPVDSDKLKEYEPWDNAKVNQFFRDYPYLVKYSPILEFPQRKVLKIGRAGFFLGQSGMLQNSYGARFSLNQAKIKFEGNVGFSEQIARWDNRNFSFKPTEWSTFQLGNFNYFDESELVYGYFPSGLKKNSSVYDSWRYGNMCNWNGISLELKGNLVRKRINTKMFVYYHERSEEKGYGLQTELRAGLLKFGTGISALFISSVPDSFYYFHCFIEYPISGFNLQLKSDVDFQKKDFPVLLSIDCKELDSLFKADLYYFPSGFYAPRSAILNRIDENVDDTDRCGGPIYFFHFRSRYSISEVFSWLPELNIKFENGVPVMIKSYATISGLWRNTNYNFRYVWIPISNKNVSYKDHQLCLNISLRIGIVNLGLDNSLNIYQDRRSYFGSMSSEMNCSKVLKISPFVSFTRSKSDSYCLGLKEKLMIFEKNSIEFQIKQSFPANDQEGFHVQCNAWFLF